jgi:hypothetical protein
MTSTTWAKVTAACALGTAVAFLLPASAAVSQSSPPAAAIRLGTKATLAVRGVVIYLPISITCPAGDQASLFVQVSERVGNTIAQGSTSPPPLPCTGSAQNMKLPVVAQTQPFQRGISFGQGQLTACGFSTCASASGTRIIHIK